MEGNEEKEAERKKGRRRRREENEEEEESGFESLPTTRRDTCGREDLLCLWKARKWRGLLSPGTRSLPRTCRKVRVKPLFHPFVPSYHALCTSTTSGERRESVFTTRCRGKKDTPGATTFTTLRKYEPAVWLHFKIDGKPKGCDETRISWFQRDIEILNASIWL